VVGRTLRPVGARHRDLDGQGEQLQHTGGTVSAQVRPGPGGGSSIHVTWNRTGVDFKSRILLWLVKLSGGKPLADSIKQGFDKVLESERRPKAGTTPGIKVEAAGAASRER
jgi:hypothetical protein